MSDKSLLLPYERFVGSVLRGSGGGALEYLLVPLLFVTSVFFFPLSFSAYSRSLFSFKYFRKA